MSRITGLLSTFDTTTQTRLLDEMASAVASSERWTMQPAAVSRANFAWCGWRQPNIVAAHGILAVMDGCVFNRAEFDPVDNDARLLISLYESYGFEEALRMINGDFAVALYDPTIDMLWLGRDRLGLKPLYYIRTLDFFAFASRPRPLLGLPGVSREVNPRFAALFGGSHYRTFDNDPEASPYQAIAQLPAGHLLCLKYGQITKKAYWTLEDQPDFEYSEAQLAETYRALLLDAVALRLREAQRPAFTLSGGMDSSSVLASAVRGSRCKQHAFSTVYTDKTYDESDEIRSMLDLTVEQWHTVRVDEPDVFSLVQKMVAAHDEPVATATWLSHYVLCEETKKQGFGALFGGLGGDELNAGEYEYFFFNFADLRAAGNESTLAHETALWARYHDHPIYRKDTSVMEEGLARLVDLSIPGHCLPDRRRITRYADTINREYFDIQAFQPVMDHPFRSYLKNRTYQDLLRETIPCCLRAEDRQTAAFGLDNYLPFFDYRLVEFMFRVPGNMKIRDGVTKRLLREAMRDILPEETRTRIKKTGWNAPAHVWFSGKGLDAVRDLAHSQAFCQRGIYNVPRVWSIIDEHDRIMKEARPVENHMMFLWQLVNLEMWLDSVSSK